MWLLTWIQALWVSYWDIQRRSIKRIHYFKKKESKISCCTTAKTDLIKYGQTCYFFPQAVHTQHVSYPRIWLLLLKAATRAYFERTSPLKSKLRVQKIKPATKSSRKVDILMLWSFALRKFYSIWKAFCQFHPESLIFSSWKLC